MNTVRAIAPAPGTLGRKPACTSPGPDLWFGPDGEHARDRAVREVKAKAICAGCPVRLGCLLSAKERGERFGIWGGEDFERPGRRVCGNGLHLMDAVNLYVNPSGVRNCRACRNAYEQQRRAS